MGAGIAAQFRRRYPQMYDSYRKRCARGAMLPGDVLPWRHADGTVIFNLAIQGAARPVREALDDHCRDRPDDHRGPLRLQDRRSPCR
jgi:hypothetical protein